MELRRERVTAADCAWWHMEEPTNPMVITAVLTFRDPLDPGLLRERLEQRLLALDRFRQRVREPGNPFASPSWEEDAGFDLDRHLRTTPLPGAAQRPQLEALVGRRMSTPLDPERPLWRFDYVPRFGGGSALVAQVHHCVADGIELIHLLLEMDDVPGNAALVPRPLERGPGGAGRSGSGAARALSAARSLAHLVAMRGDPHTSLRGRLSATKRAAWSEPLPFQEIRRAARALHVTVHDLIACAVAGGLRGYLERRGGPRAGKGVRAVVPVNLRSPADIGRLGNRFGLVFLPLPVGEPDVLERLARVRSDMDDLKRSPEAVVVFDLLRLFGRLPKPVQRLAVDFLGRNATVILTDVPGPRAPVRFCGSPVSGLMAWVPQSGRLGIGISLLSYADEIRVGVASDAGLVPDPEAIVSRTVLELRELLDLAGGRNGGVE